MTEPVLGSYYTFKYIGGNVYAPSQMIGEGMFIGRRGSMNVFATVLPKREASPSLIQTVDLTYTPLAFYPIHAPSDKVMMTTETYHVLLSLFRSNRWNDPHDNKRTSPNCTLTPTDLLA